MHPNHVGDFRNYNYCVNDVTPGGCDPPITTSGVIDAICQVGLSACRDNRTAHDHSSVFFGGADGPRSAAADQSPRVLLWLPGGDLGLAVHVPGHRFGP